MPPYPSPSRNIRLIGHVGEELDRLRLEANMTLLDLTERAGYSDNTPSNWRRHQAHAIKFFVVQDMLEVLGYELTIRKKTEQ